ncbi:unnamed protein product [Discula destructiva]
MPTAGPLSRTSRHEDTYSSPPSSSVSSEIRAEAETDLTSAGATELPSDEPSDEKSPEQSTQAILTHPTQGASVLRISSKAEDEANLQQQALATYGDDNETYPEGGLRAWLVVLGCWFALIASLGLMNTLATFQTYLISHQLAEHDEGTVGWIFSIYTFVVFFLGLYIGPLFDKYGPRWIVLAGTVFIVLGLVLMSISTELWHFILSFGLVTGLGCSLLFTPSFAAPGHFFMRRRGIATGLAATGGSIGGIVFPLMLEAIFPRLGWAWSIRVLALMCLALCAAANLLIRRRLPPASNASAHPDFRIFRNRAFALTTAGIFLIEFALFIPITYLSSYARAQGFSTRFSYQIVPILNAASAFGRALPGYWGDVIGPFNINLLMIVLSVVACLGVWLPAGSHTAGLVVFAVVFGFASGSNVSITPVCVGRLCRTQEYGRYYATCYTIVSFACLVGVPIGGNILTSNGGAYWGVIVFTGCIYVGAFASLAGTKVCSVGWKPWVIF